MSTEASLFNQATIGDILVTRLVEFVRLTRKNGFQVGIAEAIDAIKVAELCFEPMGLYWGLRALLCSKADDWRRFDQLFDSYWQFENSKRQVQSSSRPNGKLEQRSPKKFGIAADSLQVQLGDDSDAGDGSARGGACYQATHLQKDFRFLTTASDIEAMALLVQRLAYRMRRRLRRRWQIAHEGKRLQLRHTVRYSLSYGGTPLEPVYSQRRRKQPRLILFLDVSRSMNIYSYFFLRFAHGIISAFDDAHAFIYHTHLVSITDALREQSNEKLKEKLTAISAGWAGGTRIGDSLQYFNQQFGRKLLSRGTLFMVLSDGLDTGSPALLAEQLKIIKQRVRRLIWLNPLLGREGYQPLAGGMVAALPLLDVFAPAFNLETLAALESVLIKI